MFTLWLDESGDHSLEKINPQYPVFVLGGVITRDADAPEIEERVRGFKRQFCGGEEVILHTADLTRNRNGFEFLKDVAARQYFYEGLNRLMRELPYFVLAVAIRKDLHKSKYGSYAKDPYLLALDFLLERFLHFLSGRPGAIEAECRNPALDGRLQAAYQDLLAFGTDYASGETIARAFPPPLPLVPKSANRAGLQLADLVVTPIGRHVIGKTAAEDWRIVEQKFRRGPSGDYLGWGLKIFP